MSWKNKIKDIFGLNREEVEEQQNSYEVESFEAEEQEHQNVVKEEKKFRFPTISESDMKTSDENKLSNEQQKLHSKEPYGEQAVKLPNHLKSKNQKVFDIEVSGIKELLEKRQQQTGRKVLNRSVSRSQGAAKKLGANLEGNRSSTVKAEQEPARIDPLENGKRFIPSTVPSPVYGYNKPKDIEVLLSNRNFDTIPKVQLAEEQIERQEQAIQLKDLPKVESGDFIAVYNPQGELISNVERLQLEQVEEHFTSVPSNSQQTIEVNEQATTSVQEQAFAEESLKESKVQQEFPSQAEQHLTADVEVVTEQQPSAEKQQLQAEHNATEALENMQEPAVKHVTIENSTIHIAQLNVEQMPVKELASTEMPQQQEQVQEVQVEQKPKSTGSRLPFNVLMLKSDKEKLANKNKMANFVYQSPYKKPLVQNDSVVSEQALQQQQKKVTLNESEIIIEQPLPNLEDEVSNTEIVEEHILPNQEDTQQIIVGSDSEPTKFVKEQQVTEIEHIVEAAIKEPIQTAIAEEQQRAAVEEQIDKMLTQPINQFSAEATEQAIEEQPNIQEEVLQVEEPPLSEQKQVQPYNKPPLDFLTPPEEKLEDREWMDEQGERLVEALSHFQIQAQIEGIVQGPAVTQFEITVGHGTKVSKVKNLSDDIKLALAARDIRIDAPIPGKRSIGIEIPNRISRAVRLSEVTNSESFQQSDSPLEAALGLDLTGKPVTLDLRKMPHGLIAGATGSGKSVCINSILVSLLYKAAPHELKLMLIDPKMVELAPFNNIPHLVSPVITDVKAATASLKWAVEEMERRYQLFMHANVRDITRFNKLAHENGQHAQKLPYILIVIDELADLMMMSPADVEEAICRIAQKARACGIHLIVATQRPSVDVITGTIKSNIPTRIAFAVSSQIDSRTIIDSQGAERLLGRGDMLYLGNGSSAPVRIQGTFVTDEEIEEVIEYVRQQGEPDYIFKQEELLKKAEASDEQDELFEAVCRFVFEQQTASTSLIQRQFRIGYNRAARLVDMLEQHGFISEQKGSKARDVFINESDLISIFG